MLPEAVAPIPAPPGTGAASAADFIGRARFFVEANAQMPRTFGRNQIHISQVAGWVRNDTPLVEVPPPDIAADYHTIAGALSARIPDGAGAEVALDPVSHRALRALLGTQRPLPTAPAGLMMSKISRLRVTGDPAAVRAAVRAWIAQAVTWHDPTVLGLALAGPGLESDDWSWLKWRPHVDVPGAVDGLGPAR